MTKANRLPACRHVEIGAQLQQIHDQLVHLAVELSNTYRKASVQAQTANRAQASVDELRNVLDTISSNELPDDEWSTRIYYGANHDVSEVEVARVLKAHRATNPPCCADEPWHG